MASLQISIHWRDLKNIVSIHVFSKTKRRHYNKYIINELLTLNPISTIKTHKWPRLKHKQLNLNLPNNPRRIKKLCVSPRWSSPLNGLDVPFKLGPMGPT